MLGQLNVIAGPKYLWLHYAAFAITLLSRTGWSLWARNCIFSQRSVQLLLNCRARFCIRNRPCDWGGDVSYGKQLKVDTPLNEAFEQEHLIFGGTNQTKTWCRVTVAFKFVSQFSSHSRFCSAVTFRQYEMPRTNSNLSLICRATNSRN